MNFRNLNIKMSTKRISAVAEPVSVVCSRCGDVWTKQVRIEEEMDWADVMEELESGCAICKKAEAEIEAMEMEKAMQEMQGACNDLPF